MSSTDVALIFSGIILPVIFIALIAFLGKWMIKDKNLSSPALSVGIPAALCVASFLILDMLWMSSLLSSYPTEATVLSTSSSMVDNTWWSNNYGDEYNIGDDRYIESFCVPYHQFALVTLQWKCPMTKCTGSVLAMDCGQRDICQEDCTVNVDDGIERQEYNCDYADSGADDDGNNNNNNGDDDNNNNGDDDGAEEQQITEEEMLECAEDAFPDNSIVGIITDCSKCTALTTTEYEWVKQNEKYQMSHVYQKSKDSFLLASIVGLVWGATSLFFYYKTNGGEMGEQDDKEISLVDSESTTESDDRPAAATVLA